MDAYKDIAHTLEQAKKYGADVSDLEPRLPELARGILKNQVSDTGGKLLTILQGARDVGVKISDIDDGTLLQLRTATEEIKK